MGFFILFVALAAVMLMSAAFTERARSQSGSLNQTYQQLAKRFGGQCVKGGWFSRPRIHFRYGDSLLVMRPVSHDGTEYLQATLAWPDRDLVFAVGTHDAECRATWSRQLPNVHLDEPLSSRMYFHRANAPEPFRKLLTTGVQWQIQQLWHFRNYRSLLVTLDHGTLTVQKLCSLRRYEELEEFTRLVMELFDQMQLTRTVGIQFVAGDSAQAVDDPICKICGDEIHGDMVFCRRCKTPHHGECWNYFGACSVYGCGETTFVVPQTAHRHPGPHDSAAARKPR